jgi:hypothetical protein
VRVDGVLGAAARGAHPQGAALPEAARVLLTALLSAVAAVVATAASGQEATRAEHDAAGETAPNHLSSGDPILQPALVPIPLHHAVLLSRES